MQVLKIYLKAYKFCIIIIAVMGFLISSLQSFSQSFFTFNTDTLQVDTLQVDTLQVDTLLVEDPDTIVEFEFNVVAILPFYSLFIETESNSPTKRMLKMREIAVESLNGIRWAAERIRSAGYNVTVTILEEVPDSDGIFNWSEEDLIGADVVMGPMQQQTLSKSIKPIRRVGAEHILITRVNDNLLRGNEHIRSIIPSPSYFLDLIAERILSKHYMDNIIFLTSGGVEENMENQFHELFKLDSLGYNSFGSDSLAFNIVSGSKTSVGDLADKLYSYKRSVIVTLASKSSRSILSNLQMVVQSNDSAEVFVFAHSDLKELGFIDIQFLSRTRATIPEQGLVNWSDSTTLAAIGVYRKLYNSDPPKFALRSHDALLDAFQRNLVNYLTSPQSSNDTLFIETAWDLSSLPGVVATEFNWVQKYEFGGFVNSDWTLATFHQNSWCTTDTISDLPPFILLD
jgi:hypothetical protein